MSTKIKKLILELISMRSSFFMAISCSVGFAMGMFPLDGIRGAAAIVVALMFRLNVLAMILGIGISYIIPICYMGITRFAEIGATWDTLAKISNALNDFNGNTYSNSTEFLVASFLSIMMVLIVSYPYGVFQRNIMRKMFLKSVSDKVLWTSLVALCVGMLPVPRYFLLIAIVPALFLKLNLVSFASGILIGTFVMRPSVQWFVHNVSNAENKSITVMILTGQLNLSDFIQSMGSTGYFSVTVVLLVTFFAFCSYPFFKYLFKALDKGHKVEKKAFVFHDELGVRWNIMKRVTATFVVLCVVFMSVIGTSQAFERYINPSEGKTSINITDDRTNKDIAEIKTETDTLNTNKNMYGFYVSWDEKSRSSLEANIHHLRGVIPDWFKMNADTTFTVKNNEEIDKLAISNKVEIYPLISNYIGDKWNGEVVEKLITTKTLKESFINNIVNELNKGKYTGLNLDFEYMNEKYKDNYTSFVQDLKAALSSEGLKLIIDVEVTNSVFDYAVLSKASDAIIAMLYDENTLASAPGAVSSWEWYKKKFEALPISKDKLIPGMGIYGYDWNVSKSVIDSSITFEGCINVASQNNAIVKWDEETKTLFYEYSKGSDKHIVHFNDATVFFNQWKYALNSGCKNMALWRLGSEDQGIWSVLDKIGSSECSKAIEGYSLGQLTNFEGEGEVLMDYTPKKAGERTISLDPNGFIGDVKYQSYPQSAKFKFAGEKDEKRVALSFDDGPDPQITTKILDILKEYNVKATFFVLGESVKNNPSMIRREYREGHELGNHTYSHIDISKSSVEDFIKEIQTTHDLVKSITDYDMTLYRQPYSVEVIPPNQNGLDAFVKLKGLGYNLAGSIIDTKDWENNPTADDIVDKVTSKLDDGSIILMHDIGDKPNSLEAIPKIIESLRLKGYEFTTISGVIGNEAIAKAQRLDSINSVTMKTKESLVQIYNVFQTGVHDLFVFGTITGIVRFIFLIFFATRQKRNSMKRKFVDGYCPRVSVVIAAYNEEKVICKTVDSILMSNYEDIEVVVVNDGSKDNTADVVVERYSDNHRVRLVNKTNGGKATAVNRGFMEASGEIVIVLDADTIISSDAVSLLVRHFHDDNVAAVSGNVKVGNVNNLWTLWQHIEYVTGLNLERRSFDELNCINVVPGAIGAWRKKFVVEAGYYTEDTLAEDADITLTFLQKGYKIVYEEGALAFTEAPEDVGSFIKQRLRWAYGTLQCLWKHKGALFNRNQPTLGFIALPNMWLYQFIFQTISPLTDILFVISLFGENRGTAIAYYFIFFAIDFIITYYAFTLEGEDKKPLIWLFLQRLVYRQIMTYIVYKSAISAVKGVKVGWNKLKRKGNVNANNTENVAA